MKRLITLLTILLVTLSVNACPPPTSHAIIHIGGNYKHITQNKEALDSKNLGLIGKIGWEEPYRFITLSAVGSYSFVSKYWSAGGEMTINPLGAFYGYDTPVNFAFLVGGGWKSANNGFAYERAGKSRDCGMWYARAGLELSGRMGKIFTPYFACTCDFNGDSSLGINIGVGMRFWIGKDW